MNNFSVEYQIRINTIDEYMKNAMEEYLDCEKILFDAMNYSVFNGGKRIRSILCMETARMLSNDIQKALPFSTAIEFIHAFSLIHDDLPCMDNADLRRGMPSCHKKYGEAIALLAGDALLNTAFEVMLKQCREDSKYFIEAMKTVADACGVHGMINGQIRDIELEASKDATEEKLIRLIEQKTMALMMASVKCGAIVSGADENTVADLTDFAYNLGVAFQIRDDFEDEEEDEQQAHNSPNFINTLGRDKAYQKMNYYANRAKNIIDKYPNNEFIVGLLEFLFD